MISICRRKQRLIWAGWVAGWVLLLAGCAGPIPPAQAVQSRLPPRAVARPAVASPAETAGGELTVAGVAAEVAQALAQARPGWNPVVEGDDWVELWQGPRAGAAVEVAPLHAAVLREPQAQADLVDKAVQSALWLYDHAGTWDQAREHVLPRLISEDRLQELMQDGTRPVTVPVTESLALVFDLAVDGRKVLVHEGLAVAWGQSDMAVLNQARLNLDKTTHPLVRGPDGVWQFPETDAYGAARILLTHWFDRVGPGPVAIAMPTPDTLYLFPTSDPDLVERMRRRTEVEYGRSQEPLVTSWFQWQDGAISLFDSGG